MQRELINIVTESDRLYVAAVQIAMQQGFETMCNVIQYLDKAYVFCNANNVQLEDVFIDEYEIVADSTKRQIIQ